MKLHRGVGLVLIAGVLLLGGASGHAQTPLDSPITQSAAEALAEAQMRRQFEESKRLFSRRAPEDVPIRFCCYLPDYVLSIRAAIVRT